MQGGQAPTINLEELAKTFRPFNVPPPPVAMDPAYQDASSRDSASQQPVSRRNAVQQAPTPEGVRAELQTPSSTIRGITRKTAQPFLARQHARHEIWLVGCMQRLRDTWLAISVKRQRKLKMKKHKYKKLMRKTRNLRRRLDRL